MIVIACLVLAAALFFVMLSFTTWAQLNMKWITSFKFYVVIGIVVAAVILYLVNRVGEFVVRYYE